MKIHLSLRRLVPADLEREFVRLRRISDAEGTSRQKADVLDIDLSMVSWVDLGAAAQLVIQIDGWTTEKSQVTIKLPSLAMRDGDLSEHDRQLRVIAGRFLRYIRFREAVVALAARRGMRLKVLLDDRRVADTEVEDAYPSTYKRVLPLHWVLLADTELRDRLARHLADALQNSGDGIRAPDAQALANVVLFELVQNVVQHSQSGEAALVCGFAHTDAASVADYFASEEQPFLQAAYGTQQPILEVIVADGGRGLSQTLEAAYRKGPGERLGNLTRNGKALAHNIVRWSFDRWSSEKPEGARERGVRGLFRVDRLVAKYFGQIAVRTAQVLFVREHLAHAGPVERYNKAPQKYAHQFGTFIRIRMTGASLPSIEHLVAGNAEPESAESLPALIGRADPKVFVAADLDETGLGQAAESEIVDAVRGTQERPTSLYVTFSQAGPAPRSIEHALRFLSDHSGPVPIYAVNVRCSLDEFETTVSAINAESDDLGGAGNVGASRGETRDPLMAVHESGAVRWIGLPKPLEALLKNLRPGQRVEVPKELREEALRLRGRLAPLLELEPRRQGSTRRFIRCAADLDSYVAITEAQLKQTLTSQEVRPRAGKGVQTAFLTPTLSFVDRWFHLDGLLERLPAVHASDLAFGLSRTLLESFRLNGDSAEPDMFRRMMIMREGRTSSRIYEYLVRNLNLYRFDVGSESSARLLAGTKPTPVIVYTDVVRSGESLRRAAQTVLRQGFSVSAIVAMIDMRRDADATIEAFGQKFKLIKLITLPGEVSPSERFSVLAPSLQQIEGEDETASEVIARQQQLLAADKFVWQNLRFGHSIRPNGRHLTLTLKQHALLRSNVFVDRVRQALRSEELFTSQASSGKSLLVLSVVDDGDREWIQSVSDLFGKLSPSLSFDVQVLKRVAVGSGQEIVGLPRISGKISSADLVIVFDWGMISGKTIDTLTNSAVNNGAKRVIVLVGNSQIGFAEYRFRQGVRKLARTVVKQLSAEADFVAIEEPVEYKFIALSRLALGHFSESDCPVCSQVQDLRDISCPDHFLSEYSDLATTNLSKSDVNPGRPFKLRRLWLQELATSRALLVAAQHSTSARFAFADRVDQQAAQTVGAATLSPADFAMIELLYVEGQWLQLPPVRYRRCKQALKTILLHAIAVADADIQPKAIAVLRRLSKTDFIRTAPSIFRNLRQRPKAQKALLMGIHTYLAKRYHETLGMIEPATDALTELDSCAIEDGTRSAPAFAEAYSTIKYLKFQANFLRSRTESRRLDVVSAVNGLVAELSEPNYFAHGVQNQTITRLLNTAIFVAVKQLLDKGPANIDSEINPLLKRMVPELIADWDKVHRFMVTMIIPKAEAARDIFESRDFEEFVDDSKARWLRDLLDKHREGLAPELAPGRFLRELLKFMDGVEGRLEAREMLELLSAYREDVSNLYDLLLRAERISETGGEGRRGVPPGRVRQYLDSSRANLLNSLGRVLANSDEYGVTVTLESFENEQASDVVVFCQRDILKEAISEILKNAGKYGVPESDNKVAVRLKLSDMPGRVLLQAINRANEGSASRIREDVASNQRHGIGLFKKFLNPFDAQLDAGPSMDGDGFTAQVSLRRW